MHGRTRRLSGNILVGLGAFLIVAAALMRFYAYPALAKVPTNLTSDTYLSADGATIFDAASLTPITTDLAIHSHTVANSRVDAPDDVVSWVNRTTILDGTVDGATCEGDTKSGCLQQSGEQYAFGDVSGAGVKCDSCGSYVDYFDVNEFKAVSQPLADGGAATVGGQIYKFPFDTQKHDYQNWDGNLGQSTTAKYSGEQKIDGLTTYKFVQTIPDTVLPTTQTLPGKVFGVDDATVDAAVHYSMVRTLWVEPVTGAPVNRTEVRNQYFEYDGKQVTAFEGTVAYTDHQVKDSVSDAKSQSFLLGGIHTLFPIVSLLLGLAAIAAGVLLGRRSAPADSDRSEQALVSA